ncbi:MAG: SNF2-related protein [Candidatus Levybacteria bacterium]|nr:SNF2-related protein [Candidatus Levybacteria bacterium]
MNQREEKVIYQKNPEEKGPDVKPIRKVSSGMIDKIVTLNPSSPDYPLKRPFEDYYSALSGQSSDYVLKCAIAEALVNDGRYENIKFLRDKFIPSQAEIPQDVFEMRDRLNVQVREALIKRGDKKELIGAQEELVCFVKEASKLETPSAKEFQKLLELFGSSRAVDILFRTRPEFRGLPVDHVQTILADYYGDVLLVRRGFYPDDVKVGLEHLSEPDFQEGLYEVVKDDALKFYNIAKKSSPAEDKMNLINEYFEIIGLELEAFKNNPTLTKVINRVREYYYSVISETRKPPQIVDSLKKDREFPDINQLINIKEIKDNKREAIADEMGLGKSAAPIEAKEELSLKTALITAPSNVIPTWKKYLSDETVNGKQVGYFKPGQAPKVCVIENLKSLQEAVVASPDYVLISHEKLNEFYTPLLSHVSFDMLIVDEIHKLKNLKQGVRASNLLRLAQRVEGDDRYLVLLSGTPVPNKVKDVAIILKLLYPDRFKEIPDKVLVNSIIDGDIVDLRNLLIPRMQMKSLQESIEMPELTEEIEWVDLSSKEREIYEILMEEDELEAKDKIRILRQFLLNPALIKTTPGVESSKAKAVNKYLNKAFTEKNKIVMFVNGFIEDVIRGENDIYKQMKLPEGVEIRVIHGNISDAERIKIQEEFNNSDKKIFLAVSGQAADVGIDLSGGEEVIFYNEPWTKYDKKQQLGRVYREGLKQDLRCTTFLARNTIEEGIHKYIEIKYQAIEKLLRGIPITVLEKELLKKTEKSKEENLEVNPELAEYYFSSWDRMMKIFAHIKEIGEEDFMKFISEYGRDYAECYVDLGSRSYQANACRVSGTLIDSMVKKDFQNPDNLKIIDIASGPEVLRRHIADEYQNRILSLDINSYHFEGPGGKRIVGSFSALPIENEAFDYANLSLALHYTRLIPSQDEYERLFVIAEINRVLKVGGKAVINLMYNLDIKDAEKLQGLVDVLGFKIIGDYSGDITVGQNYASRVITLEKIKDIEGAPEDIVREIDKESFGGLKFSKTKKSLRDSRKIVKEFEIDGKDFQVNFNKLDKEILQEEENIVNQGNRLKEKYIDIKGIPTSEILENKFVRILVGKNYVLFKRLEKGSGVVVIK